MGVLMIKYRCQRYKEYIYEEEGKVKFYTLGSDYSIGNLLFLEKEKKPTRYIFRAVEKRKMNEEQKILQTIQSRIADAMKLQLEAEKILYRTMEMIKEIATDGEATNTDGTGIS